MAGESPLGLGQSCDGFRLRACVLRQIAGEQGSHGCSVFAHFFYRAGKPLVDRPVHQAIGKKEHHDDGQEREQQPSYHQPCTKLRPKNSQPALGKKLQQVARQYEGERHEQQKNHRRERGEKQKLLIGVRIQKRKIE